MGSNKRGWEQQYAQAMQGQAQIAQDQWNLYEPNLKYLMGQAREQMNQGLGAPPQYVREAFDRMEGLTRDEYAKAGLNAEEQMSQRLKQQGLNGFVNPNARAEMSRRTQVGLAGQPAASLAGMRLQEAQIGMQQVLSMADILRGGTGQLAAGAQQGWANQMQGLQFLMNNAGGSQWGNAMAGAGQGAAVGGASGSGYGAAIGALIGGVAGYNS